MGSSRSQRKKERHTQKRKEKRKKQEQSRAQQQAMDRQAEVVVGSNARHRQRLAQERPKAWPGERPEDAAVFDDEALSSLPPESASQATAVREALQEALELRGDDALKRVSAIHRGSPFSDWRLFLRGLIAWLADDPDAASELWKRLDPERRPGRIATAMMVALRSDLEQAAPVQASPSPTESGDEARATAWDRFDAQQLYHAKLLRRVRFDRIALRAAESGLSLPEESKSLLLGPRRIHWIQRFIAEYGDTEPELAAALAQAALRRAFAQDYSDVFDEAARTFQGPRHDRRNRLLAFFYYRRYASDRVAGRRAEQELSDYLDRDLPQNQEISVPLRGALIGRIHLNEAMDLIRPAHGGMLDMLFGAPEDSKAVKAHLLAAAEAAPSLGAVYEAHVEWIESKLDEERLTKTQRAKLEAELVEVMHRWSRGAPDAVKPRLWLVDHLLENERLEEARPHVDFLASSRHDDPRVRATPWKWQILEAMRLCRRKAWLAEVPARLDEAEALWPAWLPKDWLPYLRAALLLRGGRTVEFEEERRRICEHSGRVRDSLADSCMMLGAAQQFRVPSPELKPLREAVDRALKKLKALSMDDLLETGGFFWDLHRAQLLYPAYRMHGATIGKTLFARLDKTADPTLHDINDERIQKVVLWGSEARFWSDPYSVKLPSFLSNPAVQRHPVVMAARVNAFLSLSYHWSSNQYRDLAAPLREAAGSQRDAYNRRWFVQLADELDDVTAVETSRLSSFPFDFGLDDDDDDDDMDPEFDFLD